MVVTLVKVKKDLMHFPHEMQMYCYHHMNGRVELANTYLEAYKDEQQRMVSELTTIPEEPEPETEAPEIVEDIDETDIMNLDDEDDVIIIKTKKWKNSKN